MHFVALCLDKPNSLHLRTENRPGHLAFLARYAEQVKLGGPFLDDEGKMCGSMLIFEAADAESVKKILTEDPYAQAGLFASVEVRAYKPVVGVKL